MSGPAIPERMGQPLSYCELEDCTLILQARLTAAEAKVAELSSQILRLMAERDLLLGAIASEDYAKIKDQMVQVSESTDGVPR